MTHPGVTPESTPAFTLSTKACSDDDDDRDERQLHRLLRKLRFMRSRDHVGYSGIHDGGTLAVLTPVAMATRGSCAEQQDALPDSRQQRLWSTDITDIWGLKVFLQHGVRSVARLPHSCSSQGSQLAAIPCETPSPHFFPSPSSLAL
ncbi:hypothetical protein DPEC_G00161770 [Dallia pectoralis]|uniref:Uncharacterized protein n=1 Tax=Dallia pectoralis TaxID=75939 RepID=A0ACC2GGJ9_DALPE|nr:hypothetical protein DPEC_G00161770 [Dallia pectoralis]